MGLISSAKQYFRETGASYKRGFKRVIFAAPFWVVLIAVIMIVVGVFQFINIKNARRDQAMSDYWQQGGNLQYRELSVFARGARSGGETTPLTYIDQTMSIKKADVTLIRTTLQSVVDSSGMTKKEKGLDKEGNPVGWEDCYSSSIKANIATVPELGSDKISTSSDCEVIAVGGNYKAFYPFVYMSGGFLPEVCSDMNQIVLNDVLAWKFYNSEDIIGEKVDIWGQTFTVVGVVSECDSKADKNSGADSPRAYIYFSALENYTSSGEGEGSGLIQEYAIQCYQVMLPEQVKGVAITDIKSAMPNYNDANPQMYIVSNTDRYSFKNIWEDMTPLGEKAGILSNYELPFWEKAAWLTTQYLFTYAIVTVSGAVLLFIGIIMTIMHFKKIDKTELQHLDTKTEM